MPKSYRIRTQVGVDKSLKVNLDQDFDQINILSLKILQSEVYSRQCSDYGVVVGRVFVNGGFGLPNARISVFIPLSDEDSNNPVITDLYPYTSLSEVDEDGYRYNLLPKEPSYEGHAATGTFPTKAETLLDQSYIEVYDKYYKYTTRTNDSGDYMIFGVPLGTQTIFLDVDLSDMGCFSLTPQDLIQTGQASEGQFDGNTFKTSTNLNELAQIKTLNKIIDISPLWGDTDVCQLGITRVDFDLTSEANISVEPKAVFMGSIISTTNDDAIRPSCTPKNNTGNLCELTSGPGQILSIRQTINTDALGFPILEEFKLPSGGKVIDGDGSYLVNLPMNLDYVYTNEFGEQAISNDPKIGIPTKARYRFKFKWENEEGLKNNFQRANYLVPNIKEHGWASSSYAGDPFKTGTVQILTGTIQPLVTTDSVIVNGPGSLINPVLTNVSSFTVSIAPTIGPLSNFTPYIGDPNINITGLTNINTILVTIVPTDPTQPSTITYTGVGTTPNPVTFSIPGGPISAVFGPLGNSGLVFDNTTNVASFNVSTGPSLSGPWTPYYGDIQIISTQTPNDFVQVTPVFSDPNQPATVEFKYYNQTYLDVLKSYSFSLDWDDYADPQSAINCEDSFYEFHYNKVYTTAMFLDRYKKGLGRAKHLGIKEIDNRACKSDINTFPVNDAIRNFDFLFFIFNLLLTILTFPILVLLFIAHLISFIWPVLKYLLVFLGVYLVYVGVDNGIDLYYYISSLTNFNFAGPIVSVATILQIIKQAIAVLFYVAAGIAFIAFTLIYLIKIDNFPRIGLPMLSYPDCTTCECDCGNADYSDANSISETSVNQGITDAQSQVQGSTPPAGVPQSVITDNSFIAPINLPTSYSDEHPNVSQPDDQTTPLSGPFYYTGPTCGTVPTYFCNTSPDWDSIYCGHKSLGYSIGEQWINSGVLTAASLGYQRLLSGSESLDINNDSTGVPGKEYLHAPNQFLLSAQKDGPNGYRFFAKPYTETYSQKLNEFNLRKKYFDGVNQIESTFNYPQNQPTKHQDQVLVILAKSGTIQQIGIGEPFTFQDGKISQCNQNLTGATFHNGIDFSSNQFGNKAVTGTTTTGTTTVNVGFAQTEFSNQQVSYQLNHTGNTETYLKYNIDLEYFQLITGYTYSQFVGLADFTNVNDFPFKYLQHDATFVYQNNCNIVLTPPTNPYSYNTTQNVIEKISQNSNFEILVVVRGVDPHSPKQVNKYDLSRIFGKSFGTGPNVVGDYYLNVPIQGYTNGVKPKSHLISQNDSAQDLYFEPYNFRISETYTVSGVTCNEFTGFTSTLPYYYLCSDESIATSYIPAPGFNNIGYFSPVQDTINGTSVGRGFLLPTIQNPTYTPYHLTQLQSTINYYFAGGSFTASNNPAGNTYGLMTQSFSNDPNRYSSLLTKYAVYSPAYYRYLPTPIIYTVDQTVGSSQYLVMRSDRIPTSTNVQENSTHTSYGLHQNTNFQFYGDVTQQSPTIGVAPDPSAGQTVFDETEFVQSLTSTLGCENMKSLQCYNGSGTNITIDTNCEVPDDRVVRGCYCLLNKDSSDNDKHYFLIRDAYSDDAKLFLEWKTRFTVTFAACRGIFSQTFQNNWINGVLYMFSFNKSTQYSLSQPDEPIYKYCKDTIIFNELTNGFYYRSSPWNESTQNFIGVDSPPASSFWPSGLVNDYPGLGYNTKRIQFPTTIMDLGPRDKFISQICSNSDFNGYLADQIKSTSYQDNSDLIQMAFISRLLNASVIDQMFPIGNPSGGNAEGKGIIQFFNSDRKGERIDGDIAQALSINSEWKVTPYIGENYPNNFTYIGEDATSDGRPVFGIFFSSSTEEYRYRRNVTPGIDTISSNCGGVFNFYGYSSDQVVPHYRWTVTGPTNSIFGTENNNWNTNVLSNGGFFAKHYQDLDFNTDPYFKKSNNSENFGFITNFDSNGNPEIPSTDVVNGLPGQSILVGAPFHFYFGLNNGNTAIDKFIKLYVNTEG